MHNADANTQYAGGNSDANAILQSFSQWRSQNMYSNNDVAMLLTHRDINMGGNAAVNGLSNVGGMCSQNFGAGVVEAMLNMPLAAEVNLLLHELGHVFSLPHDGGGAASRCPSSGSIMESNSCSNCVGIERKVYSQCSLQIGS